MKKEERRKHNRCDQDTAIFYSFVNQTEQRTGLARNYSRSGMYFESDTPLLPGASIVIRATDCRVGDKDERPSKGIPEAYYCKTADSSSLDNTCAEIKTHVLAEVKRCERLKNQNSGRYGVGVHYISPAI